MLSLSLTCSEIALTIGNRLFFLNFGRFFFFLVILIIIVMIMISVCYVYVVGYLFIFAKCVNVNYHDCCFFAKFILWATC